MLPGLVFAAHLAGAKLSPGVRVNTSPELVAVMVSALHGARLRCDTVDVVWEDDDGVTIVCDVVNRYYVFDRLDPPRIYAMHDAGQPCYNLWDAKARRGRAQQRRGRPCLRSAPRRKP
jgi:hypothetical protein